MDKRSRLAKLIHHIARPYRKVEESIRYRMRRKYIEIMRQYIKPTTSIISANCFAGRVSQDLGIKYNSPTEGLYFNSQDYYEFLSRLDFYLNEAKLAFVEHSRFPEGDALRDKWEHWFPIGLLDGRVEVLFMHYKTEEEAAEKWYKRAKRVNFDDLIVVGVEHAWAREQDIADFDTLPFKKKLYFTTRDYGYQSSVFVKEFEGWEAVGDPYHYTRILYKYFVDFLERQA